MLYFMLIPFLEIHTSLFEAVQNSVTLDALFFETGNTTFWMSSLSLLCVALGVKFIWSRTNKNKVAFSFAYLREAASRINQQQLILVYIVASIAAGLIDQFIPYGSSLKQVAVYTKDIQLVVLFVLALKFMINRQNLMPVLLIFGYTVITSFYSFFSTWQDPLAILAITSLVRLRQFNVRELLRLTPILLPILLVLVIWQNVKGDYRQFLNGGAFSQRIVVSQSDALGKFQELALDAVLTKDLFSEDKLNATYRRVGYLEYFSNSVAKVPLEIPHEHGKLLKENLTYSLVPRILNSSKGVKDDKEKVEKYTDYYFGEYGGSSFSLGHYCEAYIDWGAQGMALQLFLFGILGGGLFTVLLNRFRNFNPLIALGVIWICLKPWGTFQADMITMTGQLVWGTISHALIFFPFYSWMNRFTRG